MLSGIQLPTDRKISSPRTVLGYFITKYHPSKGRELLTSLHGLNTPEDYSLQLTLTPTDQEDLCPVQDELDNATQATLACTEGACCTEKL